MARTTQDDIRRWLARGKEEKATHVIVVCDTYDWEDYPVMVSSNENVSEVMKKYDRKDMQKIMEVYNLSMDFEKQINETRSYNL